MIEFVNVTKKFGDKVVLNNLNFTIETGSFIVIIGGSGCGKTTTLKMINKLITPTSGEIFIDGKSISQLNTIDLRRRMGYVIQNVGLFPHLTLKENIELIPKLKKEPKDKIEIQTKELLNLVGLPPEEYIDKYPSELSGGQQQRVGVARAFATNSDIILMDEPFSALDPITRNSLQEELFILQKDLKKTIIFVTHDMNEALKLADKICIMNNGLIAQYDTPENILRHPADDFVKNFIGHGRAWTNPKFIKACDIMIKDPIYVKSNRNILQSIEIMKSNKVDSLLIVDRDNVLIGLITLNKIKANHFKKTALIKDVMETNIMYAYEENTLPDVLKILNTHSIEHIPVVNENKQLKGLITKSSLLSVLSEHFLDEEGNNFE